MSKTRKCGRNTNSTVFKCRKSFKVVGTGGFDAALVELWCWHGSDNIEEECELGFDVAHANLQHNVYGAGTYFTGAHPASRRRKADEQACPGRFVGDFSE